MGQTTTSAGVGGAGGEAVSLLTPDFVRRLDQLDVVTRKILAGRLSGERRSKRRGQSVEFADYRPYTHGDDLRRIDWNLYARLDRLFLRLFMEEEDLSLSVLIDVSRSMAYGQPAKLDYARKVAAALGYIGLAHHNRVGIFAFAETITGQAPAMRGRRPIPRMLAFLASLRAGTRTLPGGEPLPGDLAASIRRFALTQSGKGVVVVLSDFFEKGDIDAALKYLSGDRFDVYLVQVLAPQEIDPRAADLLGDLRLRDMEDGQTTEVSIGPALLKRYRESLDAHRAELRAKALRRGMMFMTSDTATPFEDLVLRHLRERGVVG